MVALALLRSLRRPSSQHTLRIAASSHFRMMVESKHLGCRQLSVFNEFSKHLKGEAKSNQEFQQSVKELNEKFGVVTEDLKARTKKTTEKLYKNVDDVWAEAEAASKKVSTNMKEKISAAKEEVTTNIREKFSAAKEEVKETFGLGKERSSAATSSSTKPLGSQDEGNTTSGPGKTKSFETNNHKESPGQAESLFDRVKSTISAASPKVSLAFHKIEGKLSDLAKKGYDVVKEELSSNPVHKRRMKYASSSTSFERSTKTDLVILPSKKSRLGEKWEAFKKMMQDHPIFKRVTESAKPVVEKGQEVAEEIRERWEDSDNPVVHKIQDINEAVFSENSTALSMKAIRQRDPSFSLPDFVAEVQEMIRPVLTAYHKGDVETLKKYCSSEVIERRKGEYMAYQSHGMFFDHKILHISEVEVREIKLMGSTPIIVLVFQTQEIHCVRDKEGSITAGGKDTIHTVYNAWAMQLMDIEELGEGAFYPMWKLREVQKLGVKALI